MIDSIREIQTRSLEQMKNTQEQIVSYNERIADTVTGTLPSWQLPFAQHLPKPTEIIEAYRSFLGELSDANLDFAGKIAGAWENGDKESTKSTKAK